MTRHMVSKLPPVKLAGKNSTPAVLDDCILTKNGRTAIVFGLQHLNMPQNALILMPEWHCGSEVDAVLRAGGRPVLYRLQDDLSADLQDVSEKLRKLKPWGLYCTHYFGYPQPLGTLTDLATEAGVRLIEDLALGLLSSGGTPEIGRSGDMCIYSLPKTLPLPDGGALWLKDSIPAPKLKAQGAAANLRAARKMLRRIRKRPNLVSDKFAAASVQDLDAWDTDANASDILFAPTTLTKTLLSRIPLDDIQKTHRRNYMALWQGASDLPNCRPILQSLPDDACPAFFPLYVNDPKRATAALAAEGIETVRFWRRFHPQFGPETSDRLTDLKRHTLRLPIHQGVDEHALRRMLDALATR